MTNRGSIKLVYLRPRADSESRLEVAVSFDDGTAIYLPISKGQRADMLGQITAAISKEAQP